MLVHVGTSAEATLAYHAPIVTFLDFTKLNTLPAGSILFVISLPLTTAYVQSVKFGMVSQS